MGKVVVLGEDEPTDVKYENTADLMINGETFENQDVYGDKMVPKRRTIIPGSDFQGMFGDDYPGEAVVMWQGNRYPARLSFRVRSGGGAVPVYEYFLDAKTPGQLMKK